MRVVYLDELLLLNFSADFVMLWLTGVLVVRERRPLRLAGGAAIGAVYAALVYLQVPLTSSIPLRVGFGVLIVFAAFGYINRRLFVKRLAVFYAVSLTFGGLVLAASLALGGCAEDAGSAAEHASGGAISLYSGGVIDAPPIVRTIILAGALAVGAWSLLTRSSAAEREVGFVLLRIGLAGRSVELRALSDSGNTLRSADGLPVAVAEVDALAPLFDASTRELLRLEPPDALVALADPRWRLIPAKTAAGAAMLLAFRPDASSVNGRETPLLVALSRGSLGAYPAIAGASLGELDRAASPNFLRIHRRAEK